MIIATIAVILTGLVALLHIGFLVLEMFLWDQPTGRKIFGLKKEFATQSKALAMNQGLYNGFLAAGLLWGIFSGTSAITIFFLICVIVAGVFGAATVSRTIIFVQALPAALALIFVLL